MVVVRRHGELARTRAGDGEQIAGTDVAGQMHLGSEFVSVVAVPSDERHRFALAGYGVPDPDYVEAAAVQGGPGAVAHVAVHNDAGARAVSHREHAAQREPGLADDVATEPDGEARNRDAAIRTLLCERAGQPSGEGDDLRTLIAGPWGRGMIAAKVQFWQTAEIGGDVDQAPDGRLGAIRTAALRCDGAMDADEFQRWLARDAACNLGSSGGVGNPDENPLPPASQCGKLRDFARGVDDNPADAEVERG